MKGRHSRGEQVLLLMLAALTVACTPVVTADRRSQPDFLLEQETPGVDAAYIEPTQIWLLLEEKEVWVSRLDDQANAGPWTKLRVSPGPHCVVIDTTYHNPAWPEFPRSEPLCFEAEAGRRYRVDHTHKGPENFFWVIDKKTNQVVAGERPG